MLFFSEVRFYSSNRARFFLLSVVPSAGGRRRRCFACVEKGEIEEHRLHRRRRRVQCQAHLRCEQGYYPQLGGSVPKCSLVYLLLNKSSARCRSDSLTSEDVRVSSLLFRLHYKAETLQDNKFKLWLFLQPQNMWCRRTDLILGPEWQQASGFCSWT
ncbi:hypothetical protein AVEN_120494-1 [Araneus ventricosus]|uniref:Uncharacterized protein n=1 Tax=Araneus ventricosus TaxID=182803 RepID=A0A4Y2MKD8_ARAVE|nr:hypothetical protein AVEN_120494-1 [Araneus ventricosus]